MENKLKQLHKLKKITLNDTERGFLRAHAAHIMATPVTPAPSLRSIFQRGVHHGLRIALSALLFVVFAGGTVSAVADNALPGDPLYSFKLNVNEQIKGMFSKTPEQKVANQTQRIESRLKEIKTLAESKTLTKAKQATVQKALDDHLKDLSNDLGSVAPNTALSVTANLEQSLKANKEVLLNNNDDNTDGTADAIQTVDGTLKKVSDQEVKIISKEVDAISDGVNAVPDSPTTAATLDASTDTSTSTSSPTTPFGP